MSLQADLAIILRAEDRASAQVQQAFGRITATTKEYTQVQRVLTRAEQMQSAVFERTQQVIGRVGSTISQITTIYDRWNTAQIRVQLAQDAVNKAVREYGASSEQAGQAQQRLNDALRDQQIMYVMLIAQSASVISSVMSIVNSVQKLNLALAATRLFGLGAVVGGGRAGAAIGGAALAGGVAGALMPGGLLEKTIAGGATGAMVGRLGGGWGMLIGAGVGAAAGAVSYFIENMNVQADDPRGFSREVTRESIRR